MVELTFSPAVLVAMNEVAEAYASGDANRLQAAVEVMRGLCVTAE